MTDLLSFITMTGLYLKKVTPQRYQRAGLPRQDLKIGNAMDTDLLKDEAFSLRFYIHRNIIYHARRAGFYNFIINSNSLVNIVLGSAAIASIQQAWPDYVTLSMAALIALLSAISLVYRCTEKAWLHRNLQSSYKRIEISLQQIDDQLSGLSEDNKQDIKSALSGLKTEIKHVELDEPETSRPIEMIARNETVRALYEDNEAAQHMVKINGFQRMTANIINWNTANW